MGNKTNIIKKLKEFRKKLEKDFDISKIIFFGSRATAKKPDKDSDIDLIIVSKDFDGKKFRYRAIGFYNYWDLDLPVDFICYTPKEFDKLRKQITIVSQALKEGIEI